MLGTAGEGNQLVWIGSEVEKLRPIDERIADQLPAAVTDRPHTVAVGGHEHVADASRSALDDGPQRPPLDAGGSLRTGIVDECRKEIHEVRRQEAST